MFHCHSDSLLSRILKIIFAIIKFSILYLIIIITRPLYLATFYILSKRNFINEKELFSHIYFYPKPKIELFESFINLTTTPTITFMIPYINFVNYSRDYNWKSELFIPRPKIFIKHGMEKH
ncbi:hypothetical protein RhiirB3_461310 [Rhizophagus irregularis]|nr:hypothetical protein RhiirB3_461310 [Rhizophagus irregularis]